MPSSSTACRTSLLLQPKTNTQLVGQVGILLRIYMWSRAGLGHSNGWIAMILIWNTLRACLAAAPVALATTPVAVPRVTPAATPWATPLATILVSASHQRFKRTEDLINKINDLSWSSECHCKLIVLLKALRMQRWQNLASAARMQQVDEPHSSWATAVDSEVAVVSSSACIADCCKSPSPECNINVCTESAGVCILDGRIHMCLLIQISFVS